MVASSPICWLTVNSTAPSPGLDPAAAKPRAAHAPDSRLAVTAPRHPGSPPGPRPRGRAHRPL